jgi:hypothetical protein
MYRRDNAVNFLFMQYARIQARCSGMLDPPTARRESSTTIKQLLPPVYGVNTPWHPRNVPLYHACIKQNHQPRAQTLGIFGLSVCDAASRQRRKS